MKFKFLLLSSLSFYSLAFAGSTSWIPNIAVDPGNWSTPTNWTNGIPSSTNTAVVFPAFNPPLAAGETVTITAFQDIVGLSINSISFNLENAPRQILYSVQGSPSLNNLTFAGPSPFISIGPNVAVGTNAPFHEMALLNVILGANLTITDNSTNGGLIFQSTIISDGGNGYSVTYNGPNNGTLILDTPSTYHGGTILQQGTVGVENDYVFANGPLTVGTVTIRPNTNNSLPILIKSANPSSVAPVIPVYVPISLSGNAIFDAYSTVGSVGIQVDGLISGAGSFTAANTGGVSTSLVTITGATGQNTYQGGTTVNLGATLVCTTLNALPTAGNILVHGLLNLSQSSSNTIGAISGDGTISLGNLSLNGGSFSGVIQNGSSGAGSLTNLSGSLTLTGPNTYTGGTTLSAGQINIGNGAALGTGALTMAVGTALVESQYFPGGLGNNIILTGNATINSGSYALPFNGNITGSGHTVTFSGYNVSMRGPGTLQIQSIVNSGSTLLGLPSTLLADISNQGSLIFDEFAGTYSQNVTGTGMTTVSGGANLTVTGSFQTPTTVNVGCGLTGTTTTLLCDIVDNGTVTFNQNFAGTYANALSGAGTVSISNNASILVTGSIEPSVTVDAGSSLTGTSTSLLGSITNNGIITFNQANSGTYTGNLSGSGSFVKNGTGTLTLSGVTSYSGSTALNLGGIDLSNSLSTLGSGTLTMADGTTLSTSADGITLSNTITRTGSQTFGVSTGTTTFTGDISGGDALSKTGSGFLKLQGANNSASSFAVNGGGLSIIGGKLTSPVTVAAGSTLSGTGMIVGSVVNNGNLAPGASIGTLTIVGDYTQADNSIFTNEVDSNSSDLLLVQGNVVIGSNTTFNVVTLPGYDFLAHDYTVISTAGFGTVSGNHFSQLNISNLGVGGLLSYLDDQVILTLYEGTIYPEGIFKGNPGKVEAAIETLFFDGNQTIDSIYLATIPLTSAELYTAFDAMHPALYKGMTLAQENNAVLLRNSVTQRFQSVLDAKECSACAQPSKTRDIFVWGSVLGDVLHQKQAYTYDSIQTRYSDNTVGVVTGLDYQLHDIFYIGALGGYTHSNLSWAGSRGHGDINSGYAGLYASALGSLLYGNFSVMGGWSHFDAHRKIEFTGVNQTAYNHHSGQQITSHIDAGMNLSYEHFSIRPFDSIDWIVQQEDSYTETGAGVYDLNVSSSVANMLRNELGLNFAACRSIRKAKLVADLKFSWVREQRLNGKDLESTFVGTDVPFTVIGYFPNRNLFSFGTNVTASLIRELVICTAFKDGQIDHKYVKPQDVLTFSLYYNGVFGYNYADNSFGGQLNYGF